MMTVPQTGAGMRLSSLLGGLATVSQAQDRLLSGLTLDSRRVERGALFLACSGSLGHGLDYLDAALECGAVAVVCEPDGAWSPERIRDLAQRVSVPLLQLDRLRAHASLLAARFYGEPSRALQVVGFTGTNGKTSCSHFLAQALSPQGECGLIGTLGYGFPGRLQPAARTTPDAVELQRLLAEFRDQGAGAVSMEVSSHALDQGRVAAVAFDVGVLTNLSHDHLDYHGAMQAYAEAKRRLFLHPGLSTAVLNHDDAFGRELLPDLPAAVRPVLYGTGAVPRLPDSLAGWVWAEELVADASGLRMRLRSSWGDGLLQSGLMGRFNVSNLLAVLAVLLDRGLELPQAIERLLDVRAVPGRMESFGGDSAPRVIVDYAHTPDALEQVLRGLREHCAGRLVCVFGCGGERDRAKRPLMGAIADRHADRVVLTDDNPRREDPERIIRDILSGLRSANRIAVQRNRAQAIREAVAAAQPDDIVLVAGKGHESAQDYGDLVLPFRDRDQVRQALAGRAEGAP